MVVSAYLHNAIVPSENRYVPYHNWDTAIYENLFEGTQLLLLDFSY